MTIVSETAPAPAMRRVLVVAPQGRDADVISKVLTRQGMQVDAYPDVGSLVAGLSTEADVAFLTEEALLSDPAPLKAWIAAQPPWSDFPFVVLAARRHPHLGSAAVGGLAEFEAVGNLILLERPLSAETLVNAARAALRSRARQYDAMRQLQAEAQLRRAEERARAEAAYTSQALGVAIDAGELGTFHCPLPFDRVDCSPQCRAHFQLSADETIDLRTLLRAVHADDVRRVRELFFDGGAGSDARDAEMRTVGLDGSERWIRAKGRIYRDADGTPRRFDGVTLDITAQKLLERERESLLQAERAARREAERADRMKDEFISTLSHELRTPLSAILGWTYILKRGGAEANVAKAAETIERNARMQAHLIADLLDVSRIASGNIRLEYAPVPVDSIFDAVQQTLRPTFEAKRVAVGVDPDSWHGLLHADAHRLQQIVWNLVANAVKFTPEGGQVRMRADLEGEQVAIQVTDTGIGIAPEFLSHVFERFRQEEASEARSYGGLGIGLSVVRQLVQMHGGTVEAHSDGRGRGARFVVRLTAAQGQAPAAAAEATPAGARHAEVSGLTLAGLKVMIVDDEDDGREMLATLIRARGAIVTTAHSAADAVAKLKAQPHDLLISDIGMPIADGYQLMREVRESPTWERMPAIALTAFARDEDAAKARAAGYQAHLAKPFDPTSLMATIAQLVPRPSR
jgi:signal transduction histidine kinase